MNKITAVASKLREGATAAVLTPLCIAAVGLIPAPKSDVVFLSDRTSNR